MRAICMVYRDKEDLERLKEEYDKAEKPPLDLSLKPSFMEDSEQTTENDPILSISSKVQPIQTVTKRFTVGTNGNMNPGSLSQGNPKGLKPPYSRFEFLL